MASHSDWTVILPAVNSLLIAVVLYVIAVLTDHVKQLTAEATRPPRPAAPAPVENEKVKSE